MELFFSWAWLIIVVWLIFRAFVQRGLLQRLIVKTGQSICDPPRLALIIPARNESANIGACLASFLAQDYPASRLTIIVVDDHSSDGTAQIARQMADSRTLVLRSPPLPRGWIGKSHACWIGACARPPDVEWLCFVDADVRAQPALLSSAVSAAQSDGIDLLSLAPRQELGGFAERLIIPCGLIILAFCQDLRTLQSRASEEATVTGQFMLVRARAYDAVGGHAAISQAICEDTALGRALKRQGRRVELRDGSSLLATRMYAGWQTLWPGFAKNLVDTFGGPIPTLLVAAAAALLAVATVAIPLAGGTSCVIGGQGCGGFTVALAASAALFALHIASTRHFDIPFWYGLLFPLGYITGALIAIDSIMRRLRRRVSWKGRTYP